MRLQINIKTISTRGWAWLVCAGAAVFSGSCDSSSGDLQPASEPPLAATDVPCVGADPADLSVYREKRVFLESQAWWGERGAGGTVPKFGDAEHIHVAMCFPLQQPVSGRVPFRVRVMGHNLPVGSKIRTTNLHDPAGGSFAKIVWDRTITAADGMNVVLWGSAVVNTAAVPSGMREFRILTQARRPNGTELRASSGWCWNVANGGAIASSGICKPNPKNTMARTWYNCFDYKAAETRAWAYPYGGIPRNQNYTLVVGARDGAGPNRDFTSWTVRLDPNFHNGDGGSTLASGAQEAYGNPVTINAQLLTPGVHKLVIVASANNANCTAGSISPISGETSSVLAVPIQVN